jgi:small subunit ribosomal protein S20
MPHSKSAEKRLRQAVGKRQQNRATKSRLKTVAKKLQAATGEEKDKLVQTCQKEYAQAAARGVLHKNTARRTVSRLTKAAKRQPSS